MVLELKILPLEEMEARSIARVKKSEFGRVVFRQLLQKFEDNKIPSEKRDRLLWFLGEQHEEKMCKKRGQTW